MEGVVATTGLESVLGANYHRGHDLDAYIRALSDLYSSGRAGISCLHLVVGVFYHVSHAEVLENLTKWPSLIKVLSSEEYIQGIVFIVQIEKPEQNTGNAYLTNNRPSLSYSLALVTSCELPLVYPSVSFRKPTFN